MPIRYVGNHQRNRMNSTITIPNGLRQHPISLAIIPSANIEVLRGKLPD